MTQHQSQQQRRAQILDAAKQCFVDKGYERTRVDDIAKTCKLSKGGLYFHFSSKYKILRALLEDEFERALSVMTSSPALTTSNNALAALAAAYLQRFAKDAQRARLVMVFAQVAMHDAEVAVRLQEMHEHFIHHLTHLLDVSVAGRQLHIKDTRQAAILLKATIDGLEASAALGIRLDLSAFLQEGSRLIEKGYWPTTPQTTPLPEVPS